MLSPRDERHAEAVRFSRHKKRSVLTTEFIVVELANFFAQVADRTTFVEFVRYLRGHRNTTIIPASSDLVDRGFDLFARRLDKERSLTDCTSFVVMAEHGVTEALTSDGDFEQAGFAALLK